MSEKKLGAVRLSGLIIGPILGSGILILPPLSVEVMGDWAIFGWGLMICLSFLFAFIFSYMSVEFPGDAGVANAIEHSYGKGAKQLAAFYLTGAALFGPVAVLLTAAKYININTGLSDNTLAFGILIFALLLLLRRVTSVGTVSFVMSSVSAVALFIGGAVCIFTDSNPSVPVSDFAPEDFGYGLLLLFWTIVGWEIIGNYTAVIKDPRKTLPKAVVFSALIIAVVTLTVVSAMQWGEHDGTLSMTNIVEPVFGDLSPYVIAVLAFSLCGSTYMAFTGAVARLLCALSVNGTLPKFFSGRNSADAPANALWLIVYAHVSVLVLARLGLADVESLVSLADGFFLANAMMGLFAGVRILRQPALKVASALLGLVFFAILCFSSPVTLVIIFLMAVVVPMTMKTKVHTF